MRSSWSLGPSPRQPTVVWPPRDAPPADRASGTKQRPYTIVVSPFNISIVLLLLPVVETSFNLKNMVIFRFENLTIVGNPTIWRHRILKSKDFRSDFACSDCVSRCTHNFRDRKIQMWSSKSNRIGNSLLLRGTIVSRTYGIHKSLYI